MLVAVGFIATADVIAPPDDKQVSTLLCVRRQHELAGGAVRNYAITVRRVVVPM
jgi:hypothetical protein